jgi:regulatory protein
VPVVTALRATRGGRIAVHVDGEYLCAVGESFVARWRLFKGRELEPADVDQLVRQASSERVLADAYRLLGHRSRSRRELADRLKQKGHDEEAVSAAVDRLAGEGYLDDAAFASSYVADKRRLNGWGADRIRRSLTSLGVEPDIVEAELAGGLAGRGDEAELERAEAVLSRRREKPPLSEAQSARVYQALRRRGFSGDVALTAIRRWAGAAREGDHT